MTISVLTDEGRLTVDCPPSAIGEMAMRIQQDGKCSVTFHNGEGDLISIEVRGVYVVAKDYASIIVTEGLGDEPRH